MRGKKEALDPKYKERLRVIAERVALRGDQSIAEGMPRVSEEIRLQLLQELNLNSADGSVLVLKDNLQPFLLAALMAENVLTLFHDYAPDQFRELDEWMKRNFNNPSSMNSATIGAAIVLRALQIQNGEKFTDMLAVIPPEKLKTALIDSTISTKSNRQVIISRVQDNRIPSYQFNLGDCVNKLAAYCPDYSAVQDGAVAMYSALSKYWPKPQ